MIGARPSIPIFLLALAACGVSDVNGDGDALGVAEQALGSNDCTVEYSRQDFGTGFTAFVDLTNEGLNGSSWEVVFTFDEGQLVGAGFNTQLSQIGEIVTARNAVFNGRLATGQSTSFGFQASKPSASSSEPSSIECTIFE